MQGRPSAKAQPWFTPDILPERFPDPALRYLMHAIQPGTPLVRRVEIRFHGQLRLKPRGRWMAFEAKETIDVNRSFLIIARSHFGPVPVRQIDRYVPDEASSRRVILGGVPVRNQRGPDLNRSARSRVLVESVWLPPAFLPQHGASWFYKEDTLRLSASVAGDKVEITPEIDADGALKAVRCVRWSNLTEDHGYAWIPFEAALEEEKPFGGYTIPTKVRATWWAGTVKAFDFFNAQVDEVSFLP